MITNIQAKYWCSDLQMKIAHDGVQMHGGWGYMYVDAVAVNLVCPPPT